MNAFKKFFALILSLCMVLSYVPVRAFAAETGGEVAVSDGQPLENQDIFVLGNDNTKGEVRVDHAAGVLRAESQVANVDGMTEPYVAYDIDLYTADGSYSGAATVSLPLGTVFAADAELRGFVVNGDGSVTYIDDVTRNTDLNTLTFAVSNIGIVGVTLAEEDEDTITVYIGQTITITDNTGNYETQVDRTGLDANVANVSVEGADTYNIYTAASSPITSKPQAGGTYIVCIAGTSRALSTNQTSHGSATCRDTINSKDPVDAVRWVLEDAGDGKYYFKNGTNYLNLGNANNTATLTQTPEAFTFTWDAGSSSWAIGNDYGRYFNNLGGANKIGGWTGDGTKFDVYEVSATEVPAVTYITVTGVSEGTTGVTVGGTTYNFKVTQKVEKVTLQAGDSTVIRDDSGSYTAGNVGNANVASVVANGVTVHTNHRVGYIVSPTNFISGHQYLLVNLRGNWMVSKQAGANSKLAVNSTPGIASSDPENYFWTITKHSDGVYTIQDVNGKYLTFGDNSSTVSDTRVNLNVYYNSIGNWVIRNDNSGTIYLNNRSDQPGGWVTSGQDTEVGNQWRLVEAMYDDASYTDVTVNGLTPGTTSVMVGYTRYDITVVGDEPELDPITVNVDLKVGETKKETIADAAYTMDNVTTAPDSTFATLDSVVANRNGGEKHLVEITSLDQIVSGKSYLIVTSIIDNGQGAATGASKVVKAEAYDSTSLKLGDAPSVDSTDLWTFTKNNGTYTISQNGLYLNLSNSAATVSNAPQDITLAWNVVNDYSQELRGCTFGVDVNGTTYYLDHFGNFGNKASVWNAAGTGATWRIYEIVTDEVELSTDVTFTGMKAGTTTATVGHVTYKITVEKNITDILVNLEVGQSAHYTDKTGNYQDDVTKADNFDDVATLVVTGTALSNVLGSEVTAQDDLTTGTYIIVGSSNGNSLTNVASSSRLTLSGGINNITDASVWTITETSDGYYTIQDADGKYLHFASESAFVNEAEAKLDLDWTTANGNYWYIKNANGSIYLNDHNNEGNVAGGWSNPSDPDTRAALRWRIYKVNTTGQTGVTIGAKAVGTTSVVVGNTRYVITVGERKLTPVDVTLEQFESVTLTDKTGDYTNNYTTAEDFDTYAGLELSKTQTMKVNSVSADKTTNTLETGTYIIVNNRANKTMTNQSASEGAEAGTMAGMKLNGTKDAVTGKAVWSITKNEDGTYYVQDASGKYLTIANNSAALDTTPHNITIVYEGGNWRLSENGAYLNDAGNAGTTAAGWQNTSAAGDEGSQWSIYSVDATPEYTTSITITGKEVGTTSVVVGNTQYNVTVTPDYFEEITGKGKFVGQGNNEVDVEGKPVNKLTLSPGNTFQLGVDTKTADSIVWEIGDSTVATVDQDGRVTGVAPGDTTVKATVTVAGVSNTIEIPVHITPDLGVGDDSNKALTFFYIDEVHATDVYYALYINGGASEVMNDKVEEGHVIYIQRPYNKGFGIVWLSSPHDGYSLTYMQSTGSANQYYPLHTGDDQLNTTDNHYYAGVTNGNYSGGFGGMVGNSGQTAEQLREMLQNAIDQHSIDGAMSQSRSASSGDRELVSGLSFASDKLPSMTKNVQGVMGTSGLYADWKVYHPNMYAKVGEIIFFELVVTLEVPHTWADEDETIAAVNIENADIIDDALAGAYFYTKEDDYDASTADPDADPNNPYYGLDGQLPASLQKTTQDDIHTQLNAAWTEAEKAAGQRVLTYYVVYKIPSDADPTQITNTATLNMQYKSKYSEGSSNAVSDADASIYLLGESLGDILLDFGMPVTIDGLTESDLANQFDEAMTNSADQGCKYGSVKISEYTEDGKTYWAVTYTPHTVFTGYDVVYLRDANGTLKNYFRVYPASTIHYEENFAEFGTANDPANTALPAVSWNFEKNGVKMDLANGKPAVPQGTAYIDGEELEYLYVGCSDPTHLHSNFGYTEKYVTETGMSNSSQAISKHSGDTATFTFTGTGLDVYANIDENTSIVSVMLYELNGDEEKLVKFYQVMTADTAGNADNSLPVVSVTDLKHGTYKAVIRHTKQMSDVTKEFRLDGFRIYNTMESTEVYYPLDEQNAVFVDLRDEVLSGLTGLDTSTSVSQVFSQSSKLGDVIYTTTTSNTDLLDHSPKNEIWLSGTESLTFKVGDDVGFAQIGLKAPRGEVTAKITTSLNGSSVEQTYVIKTATDMFYRLPQGLNGATVTIEVESGAMLSVTKLKAVAGSNIAVGSFEALGVMNEVELASVLDIVLDRNTGLDDDIVGSDVTRIYGDNRFETAFKVANELKSVLGVEKFESIIIASGTNFADALSGSYLATVKNAPILLSYDATYDQMVRDYIAENLAENGTVYILGGEAAVVASMDDALVASGVTVKRLAGANRFDTNLAILAEAGVENQEILICTGTNFADSLSASATGMPIMLVYNESGKLTDEQAKYLAQLNGCTFTVIGGEKAVSAELEAAIGTYGAVQRLAGEDRFQTSVAIAQRYFRLPDSVVVAYAGNYPDGLCGGVLANALKAPLILTMNGYEAHARKYVFNTKVEGGLILGGAGLISDDSVVNMFSLSNALEIIVK